MLYLVKDLLLITLGAGIGITLLVLVQAGGNADRQLEEMNRERNEEK